MIPLPDPTTPADQPLSPYQKGYKTGSQFQPTRTPSAMETEEEMQEWLQGYDDAIFYVNDRALAYLSMGTAVIQLHQLTETGWGQLMASLIQSNGNAMATIFLGAELTHARRLRSFLTNPRIEPRHLLEVASWAAVGDPLPEDCKTEELEEAYRLAKRIRFFIKGTDATANGSNVQIDTCAMMRRIVYGNAPPPEAPLIIPATRMPNSHKLN